MSKRRSKQKDVPVGVDHLTGEPLKRFLGDPTKGLGRYAKLALKELRKSPSVALRPLTEMMVADKVADPSKSIDVPFEELSAEKQKIERHTMRKTMEKLAARGLVDIFESDNIGTRKTRGGGEAVANWGTMMAYSLREWAVPIVDALDDPEPHKQPEGHLPEPVETALKVLAETKPSMADRWTPESLRPDVRKDNDAQVRLAKKHVQAHVISTSCPMKFNEKHLMDKRGPDYIESFAKLNAGSRAAVLRMLVADGYLRRGLNGRGTFYEPLKRESKIFGKTYKGPVNSLSNHIYLITNPYFPGWVKAGESVEPSARAKGMNTGSPADYEVMHEFLLPPGVSDTDLHPYFKKVAGGWVREWFFMPLETAEELVIHYLSNEIDKIKAMPKCEPPSVLVTFRNSFNDLFRHRRNDEQESTKEV